MNAMELLNKYLTSIIGILVLTSFKARTVDGSCTLPSALEGTWTRTSDDAEFTFSSTTASGFNYKYYSDDLSDLNCHTQSGDKYILAIDFTLLSTDEYRLLVCWQLEKVSGSAYKLYELSSAHGLSSVDPAGALGTGLETTEAVNVSTICDVTAEYYTMLIKNGATSSDVEVRCPPSLFANFEYTQCPGSSFAFCSDRTTAIVDYSSCPTILGSTGGVLSCMGYTENGTYTYVSLYNHDAGNGVTCLRIEDASNGGISATFYAGDCSNAGGSGTDLDLTPTKTCPLGGGESDDNLPLIIGCVVGGIALIGAVAAFLYIKNKKGAGKVDDAEKSMSVVSEDTSTSLPVKSSEAPISTSTGHPTTNGTPDNYTPANGTIANGTPSTNEDLDPSPRRPHFLPPLANAVAAGEPNE